MKKIARFSIFILLISFSLSQVFLGTASSAVSAAPSYQIAIDAKTHTDYGVNYPLTFTFAIPAGSSGLTAQFRYAPTDPWTTLPVRTTADFFNGINAARFDYANNTAYLSVSFSQTLSNNNLFLHVLNGTSEVPLVYTGIAPYYDNRKAAVTATLDDWSVGNKYNFLNANSILQPANIIYTVGVVTQYYGSSTDPKSLPDWADIKPLADAGTLEVASHSRTHPCSDVEYQTLGYTSQLSGSRDDIVAALSLPYKYVPAYLEPCGFTNPALRTALTAAGYLVDRGWQSPPYDYTFTAWGGDGAYNRAMYAYDTWQWQLGGTPTQLAAANATFDAVYAGGGIYHLMDHPWLGNWADPNWNLAKHIAYISNKKDVWYAGLGQIYLYHYIQDRSLVTVTPAGGTPLPPITPTPPSSTPIVVHTPTPSTTPNPLNTYSLWSNGNFPSSWAVLDTQPIEVGVKFRSDVSGVITGIRFVKGDTNTGTHVGHLWSNNGTLLAAVTFTNESANGWQRMDFANPVVISANTVYVASYFVPTGHYALTQPYFNIGYYNPPLYAYSTSEVTVGNGVYTYTNSFPNLSAGSSNFWVDVLFQPVPIYQLYLPRTQK